MFIRLNLLITALLHIITALEPCHGATTTFLCCPFLIPWHGGCLFQHTLISTAINRSRVLAEPVAAAELFSFQITWLDCLKKIWSHFIFIFYGKMQIYGTVLGERVVSMALLAPEYFFIPFWQGWEINIYRMECDYPWAGVQSSLLGALFAKELHEEGGVTSSFPSEVSLKYNLHFCSAKTHRSIFR